MDNSIARAIEALEAHYLKYGKTQSMEYTYGFMDAMAMLRDLAATGIDKKCGQNVLSSNRENPQRHFTQL